jgi:hypothetical protein
MAFSSSVKKHDVQGTMILKVLDFNAASVTSGYVKTGLRNIVFAVISNRSTAGAGKALVNIASDGTTAEQGGLFLSGLTSNDVGSVLVYGY